ncbi:MAG TPA: hypothetical protein VK675_03875 [Candidatus Paceibacterota bacterium]|nr:hypothetical protein [Candidatus Paceibacterota bacterium]
MHKDILKWIYIALHTNGVEGLSGHCFAKIRDSVAKHHPREFLFAIDSDDAPDSLRFAGNVATNVANGQELSFSPTTFFGGEYGAGGVTNTYTSGQLVPVNEIIVHYRVFFKYSDAASRATIESYILINDPFRLSCAMRHAATAIGDSFAVSTAPAMVMSRVNTGTNILPVFTLVGQPSLYASYTVLWAGPLPNSPAAWELFQEQLPDGYSRSFTNVGPKFFKSLRGPAQQGGFAKQVVGLVPSVGFSQTD